MELIKIIFFIAITMALTISLTVRSIDKIEDKPPLNINDSATLSQEQFAMKPSKRLSRFLAEEKNPRAADHCKKNNELCYIMGKTYYSCCNNKCMDLAYDDKNCGACKKKCFHTEACCRGECVYLSLDKRHCGACNNRCKDGEFCVYGMCSYA